MLKSLYENGQVFYYFTDSPDLYPVIALFLLIGIGLYFGIKKILN